VALPPELRSLINSANQHRRWAQCTDRTAATAPAREGLQRRFEREVDPDGVLDPTERARRAENARKAYYKELAVKSAKARAARKNGATR
jgi:hypothetical protein